MNDVLDIGLPAEDWFSSFPYYDSDSASAAIIDDEELEMADDSPFQQFHTTYSLNQQGQSLPQSQAVLPSTPIERFARQLPRSGPYMPGSMDLSDHTQYHQRSYYNPSPHSQYSEAQHYGYSSGPPSVGSLPSQWGPQSYFPSQNSAHPSHQSNQNHYQPSYMVNNSNSSSRHQGSRVSSPGASTALSSASGSDHYASYHRGPGDQQYPFLPSSPFAGGGGGGGSGGNASYGAGGSVAPGEINSLAHASANAPNAVPSGSQEVTYAPRLPSQEEDAAMDDAEDDDNALEQREDQPRGSVHSAENQEDEVDLPEDGTDSDFKPSKRPSRGANAPPGSRRKQRGNRLPSNAGSTRKPNKVTRPPHSGRGSSGHATSHRQSSGSNNSINPSSTPNDAFRPFVCPLAPYGCSGTFTSKNEWKRHINSQHICTGFWRCDLCPDRPARPNDFNRKDLFTQHLRRMHNPMPPPPSLANNPSQASGAAASSPTHRRQSASAPSHRRRSSGATAVGPASPAGPSNDEFERNLDAVRSRCWVQLRETPQHLACVFCSARLGPGGQELADTPVEASFSGATCCEGWLEHVGKHLATVSAASKTRCASSSKVGGRAAGAAEALAGTTDAAVDVADLSPVFARDVVLREWLLAQRLLEWDAREGRFRMVEANKAREFGLQQAQIRNTDADVLD